LKQQISALMDDDLNIDETSHLLNMMHNSKDMRGTWSEYQLIGDVLRGEPVMQADLTSKIMQQIAHEPVVLAPKPSRQKPVWQQSWALAASVAAVAVFGWVVVQQAQPLTQPLMSASQNDYIIAHQSAAPSNTAYLLETVSFEK